MANSGNKQTLSWFDKYNPTCNIIGLLMFIGCSGCIYKINDWDGWTYGGVFALIMGGGKAMKVVGDRFGGKGK